MQKVTLTEHNIRRVFQRLLEIYPAMKRGEEDSYTHFFLPIEGNILKCAHKDRSVNSRRVREAVDICLATINGYLNDIEYDFSGIATPTNMALVTAIQMAYDPHVNPEMAATIDKKWDLKDRAFQKRLFETPFKCLYRLRDSIDTWMEMRGSDGYLQMIQQDIGPQIDLREGWKWTMTLVD